ncbi:MAG: chemotaxis protein CheW [Gammaproteobacteria bacterium]|nr:chemotaxis protein CheW [Gammaproteobacteria bacterium]
MAAPTVDPKSGGDMTSGKKQVERRREQRSRTASGTAVGEWIHALEIPLRESTLLVPSANIAEVINASGFTPVPLAPAWLLGAFAWRTLAVPVVSFEGLMGGTVVAATPGSKIVILYPLPGRRDWEFYAILTHAEPRPQTIDPAHAAAATAAELPDTPYIAAGLKLGGRLLVIPDLEALKKAFYP